MSISPMSPEDIAKLKAQIVARKEQKPWFQGDDSPKCMMTANEILSLIAVIEEKLEPNAWSYEWRTNINSNWRSDISTTPLKASDHIRNIKPLHIRELEA